MNVKKMKVGVLITILVFIIILIVYRLYSIEGNNNNHVTVLDPLQEEKNAKIKADAEEEKKIKENATNKYNKEKSEYETCIEKVARINDAKGVADTIAANAAEEAKNIDAELRKMGIPVNDVNDVIGNVVTGKYTQGGNTQWGRASGESIFHRIRPETFYIWKSGTNNVTFQYNYLNTTNSSFTAIMNIIADNSCIVSQNGNIIQRFSGGWPSGLSATQINIYVGNNTFLFKCSNSGGPAGLAVIVTDIYKKLLFNTNNQGNDGWRIVSIVP